MAKARSIIKTALRYCAEQTNFSPAADGDFQDGVDKLNQLYQRWLELGLQIDAGQPELTSPQQTFNVPLFSIPAFEYNLAKDLWPLYNIEKPLPTNILMLAAETENQLFTALGADVKSVFPGNLSVGSGNWFVYSNTLYPQCDDPIYPCDDNDIVTEGNVRIVTEDGTEDV